MSQGLFPRRASPKSCFDTRPAPRTDRPRAGGHRPRWWERGGPARANKKPLTTRGWCWRRRRPIQIKPKNRRRLRVDGCCCWCVSRAALIRSAPQDRIEQRGHRLFVNKERYSAPGFVTCLRDNEARTYERWQRIALGHMARGSPVKVAGLERASCRYRGKSSKRGALRIAHGFRPGSERQFAKRRPEYVPALLPVELARPVGTHAGQRGGKDPGGSARGGEDDRPLASTHPRDAAPCAQGQSCHGSARKGAMAAA